MENPLGRKTETNMLKFVKIPCVNTLKKTISQFVSDNKVKIVKNENHIALSDNTDI